MTVVNKLGVCWKMPIVPSAHLAKVLLEVAPKLDTSHGKLNHTSIDDPPVKGDKPLGWVDIIAARASRILGTKEETLQRRINMITNGTTRVTSAEIADGLLLACGIYMELDTTIPTLPGNRANAVEMVKARRPDWCDERVEIAVDRLLRYRDNLLYPDGYVKSRYADSTRARNRKLRAAHEEKRAQLEAA